MAGGNNQRAEDRRYARMVRCCDPSVVFAVGI